MKKIAAFIALILLFACSRQEQLSAQAESPVAARKAGAAPPPARMIVRNASPVAARKAGAAPPPARMIVRNASLRIVVTDTAKAVDDVTASVQSLGGYLSGSEVWHEGELLRARLTLRVPSAQLSPALAAIRKLSRRVENETVTSEDVSQQYTDLGSQLRNLEATETELRELLTTVRKNARKASEILEVHQQLVSIRGEIEVTKGRMQHLSRTAEMSQIALEVMPDAITKPVAEKEWQPVVVVKNATRALLGALRGIAAALIWLVIYVVPICGIIALVAAALVAIARRLRRRIA